MIGDAPILISPYDCVPSGWVVSYAVNRLGRLEELLLEDDRCTVTGLRMKSSAIGGETLLLPIDEDGIWLGFDPRGAAAERRPGSEVGAR